MNDELLIELVRQNEDLYDMASKKYSDHIHKDMIWNKISTELNTTASTCKLRWISLRDQYRKALKKRVTKSGQAAEQRKKWKYEDCISFLQPFLKERETQSNITSVGVISDESDNEEIDVLKDVDHNEKKNKPISPKKMPLYSSKTKNKINQKETASSVLMKYLIESDKSDNKNQTPSSNIDPIDLFFNGIAATVKQLPTEYQHQAKSKIFSIVSDLEWTFIQDKKKNHYSSSQISFQNPHYNTLHLGQQQKQSEKSYFLSNQPSTSNENLYNFHNIHTIDHASTSTTSASTPCLSPNSPTQNYYETFHQHI